MKMVKSLILGSAAGLLAMSGAQAADLPVKAKAVEYVRICSLYGAGFYYIPGTDTCIKLGGYLRADVIAGGFNDFAPNLNGPGAARNRLSNDFASRARTDLAIDTRTATEYGVLRTFAEFVVTVSGGNYSGSSPSAFAGDGIAAGSVGLYSAFIQFAGFTAGRTASIFDTPWQAYPAGGPDTLPGGSNHVTGVNTLIYTADFGQGISGSVAAQDPQANDTTNVYNLSGATAANMLTGVYGANDIGGTRSPDLLAQVRVDQAWGLAQFAVVAHDNHAAYYGPSEIFGAPSDKWGWAVMGALSIKNIPTGPGDTLNIQAVYTDSATRYNFQSLFPTSLAMYGGTGLLGAYQSIGIAGISDTTFINGSGQESVTSWGFRGGYTHNWNPYWASAIYGAYAQLRYGSNAVVTICGNMVSLLGFVGTCSPNFNYAAVGFNTIWTPVKNFAITGDVTFAQLDSKFNGVITAPAVAAVAKPATVYQLKGENSVTMLLRAQRNF